LSSTDGFGKSGDALQVFAGAVSIVASFSQPTFVQEKKEKKRLRFAVRIRGQVEVTDEFFYRTHASEL
jgi:hypothetical protein